jgi:hypothetical protein
MNKIIICPFNLFELKQSIYIAKEDGSGIKVVATATMDDLGAAIAETSASNNISFIRLIGQEDYANNIANDIKKYNMQYYENRELEIEVN